MVGDFLVEYNNDAPLVKAIYDNATHTTAGLLSALVMILQTNHRIFGFERVALIGMCTVLSSLIDVDHFITAKSLKLSVIFSNYYKTTDLISIIIDTIFFPQRAVQIQQRPFLHFTTIPLALMFLMFLLQRNAELSRVNLWLSVVVCAFLSHHTRDATRRGYTLWPFVTTGPIPYPSYIAAVVAIPFLMVKWLDITTKDNYYRYQSPAIDI